MTLIASSSQRSYPSKLSKLSPHHYGIFQGTLQKSHLQLLGGLLFCVGLTLSKPAWSAPQVGSAALSVPPLTPKESVVTTSTETIPSHTEALSLGAIAPARPLEQHSLDGKYRKIEEGNKELLKSRGQNCSDNSKLEPFSVDNESDRALKFTPHSSIPLQWTEPFVELEVYPLAFRNSYSGLREPTQDTRTPPVKAEEKILETCPGINILVGDETGAKSDDPSTIVFLGQPASNAVTKITAQQQGNSTTPSLLREIKSIPSPVEKGNSLSQLVQPVPNAEQKNTDVQEFKSSASIGTFGKTGVEGTERESISPSSEVSKDLVAPFQTGLEFSSERNSELGQVLHSELLVQSQSFPSENNSESEQTGNSEDSELGILRLRELPTPPPPAKPSVYLLGGAGYFRSNNIFSALDPVDDGLFRAGVTLLAVPSLGPQTSLFASVGGNIIRYSDLSDYNYDELRFSAGIRQQIGSRTYGELGWLNRQLFSEEGGDRFLNDHSAYLELGRRDPLTRQLALDTYYQLRLSFANPSDRSQVINSLGASLAYYPFPALEAALDYQFALAEFTQQERDDQYHQLIARLTYTLSRNSRFYLFGGRSFGDSSDEYTDFDGWVFGAGVDLNLVLF